MTPVIAPADAGRLLEDVQRSGNRLAGSLAALTDAEVRAPSRLPRWSRGHVLTHVARSADAYVWMLRRARTGAESGPRTTAAALAEAVELGAARPAADVAADVRGSVDRFVAEARLMPPHGWEHPVTALAGWRHPAWYTLLRCLRELETHHVDLGLGYGTGNWPSGYVTWALDDTLGTLRARGFPLAAVEAADLGRRWSLSPEGATIAAPGHRVLGWLSGRTPVSEMVTDGTAAALPSPPPWPQPPLPGWGREGEDGA
ncbi:maleylpyruvate isomerase family mycothiol-dependent enzyme [Streptomyces sp. L2]|uniref:maleylpyruvate isomerase family mycothiol-dependent enzyme n=1 Tax=Streptomyces sp. L2 TaxID=2162665 RepID=UPI00101325DB|nr:maleylpyruvate isomerase family mycothiol-dependent enzyme [Streptomyces sp. L2]